MSAREPLLQIEDLSVAFTQGGETNTAVDRVSLEIDKGETVLQGDTDTVLDAYTERLEN